jgi:tRNA/rRNA methyltransferase
MSICVVLVSTQLPENLGSVCRVMGNFNVTDLRLVTPAFDMQDTTAMKTANAVAVQSYDILSQAKVFSSLADAVQNCKTVIGTTAEPRQLIKFYNTPRTLAQHLNNIDQPIALVFGPERTGLNNDEVAMCNSLVRIPVNEERSSLNLSHACAILLYELHYEMTNATAFWQTGETDKANQGEVDHFLNFLEDKLDQTHFWRTDQKKAGMKRNLFGMFKRQTWFQQDLKTLRGLIDALISNKK